MKFTDAQRERILVRAEELGMRGSGGGCWQAALAINDLLFDGGGRYIAVLNRWLLEHRGDRVGHVGVEHGRKIWDSQYVYDGRGYKKDFLGEWSIIEPGEYGITPRQAEDGVLVYLSGPELREIASGSCEADPYRILRAAIEEELGARRHGDVRSEALPKPPKVRKELPDKWSRHELDMGEQLFYAMRPGVVPNPPQIHTEIPIDSYRLVIWSFPERWALLDGDRVIGGGSYTMHERGASRSSRVPQLMTGAIRKDYRGRGLYQAVVRAFCTEFGAVDSDQEQTASAAAVWRRMNPAIVLRGDRPVYRLQCARSRGKR